MKDNINFKISKILDTPEVVSFAAEKRQEEADQKAANKEVADEAAKKKAEQDRLKKLEESKPPSAGAAAWDNFKKYFLLSLGIILATLFGSLMANANIHRHPAIRLIYFIYGSVIGVMFLMASLLLWFLPVVALAIIIFMKKSENLPRLYSYLPLSSYQSDNAILRFILKPFTYIPSEINNSHIANKVNEYKEILKTALA